MEPLSRREQTPSNANFESIRAQGFTKPIDPPTSEMAFHLLHTRYAIHFSIPTHVNSERDNPKTLGDAENPRFETARLQDVKAGRREAVDPKTPINDPCWRGLDRPTCRRSKRRLPLPKRPSPDYLGSTASDSGVALSRTRASVMLFSISLATSR